MLLLEEFKLKPKRRKLTRQIMEKWFSWMDRILDIHRANFVFREASREDLEQHKIAVGEALRVGRIIQGLILDHPDLLSRRPDAQPAIGGRLQHLSFGYSRGTNRSYSATNLPAMKPALKS